MTSDAVGGVWTYTIDLCRGLANYGVEVVVLSMGRLPHEQQMQEASDLPNVTLIAKDYRLEWMNGCEADLQLSGELLVGLEQQFRPDIVHLNTYWHATLPLQAPRLLTAHSCVPSWWAACRGTLLPEDWASYVLALKKAVTMVDMVVAPSAAYLREFQRLHGTVSRWRLIRNGRDPSLFRTGPKRNLVFAAGRLWDEAKNIASVCEAAGGLGIPVVVAGDETGPHGEHAPHSNVEFLGPLPPAELANCMANASIFVSPARYEPFGLTILEAALSACALVLGDIPTLRELWDGAAVFVDPCDAGQLRSVLRNLCENPGLTQELGARANARAGRYSLEKMAQSYHQTYCAMLSERLGAVA
jgi:glycosyltransferase involved in cell wall biosynthesis